MREPVRLINTRAHAIIDYVLGVVLLLSPSIFDYSAGGPEYWIPAAVGVVSILMALITRFEFSVAGIMPLKVHLYLDVLCGLFLAGSPWIFGFCPRVFKPHLVFGLAQVVVAALTDRLLHDNVKEVRASGKPVKD